MAPEEKGRNDTRLRWKPDGSEAVEASEYYSQEHKPRQVDVKAPTFQMPLMEWEIWAVRRALIQKYVCVSSRQG